MSFSGCYREGSRIGTAFLDMLVAKDLDTERAFEDLQRIKGKKKKLNEMKGRRDQR